VRHEQEAGTKWKRNGTHLPQAHEKHNTDFFIFLHNYWVVGNFEDIARSAKQKQAAERSLATAPIFENLLCFFYCYPKYTFNKKHKWFSGHYFRIGGTPEQRTDKV
jgi:hypothetical protein